MAPTYPTVHQIEEMFSDRDIPSIFNTYLADNVDVTVVGKEFAIAGTYKSSQAFHDAVFSRVSAALKVETIRLEVLRVIGGGDSPWAAVESLGTATSKYGELRHPKSSHFRPRAFFLRFLFSTIFRFGISRFWHWYYGGVDKPFYTEFVDLVRFNSQGKIAQMKEYFDNGHMHGHVAEHEEKQAK